MTTDVDRQIEEHRTAQATVTVVEANGRPVKNQEVAVAQRDHQFLFGCAAFEVLPIANGQMDPEKAETFSKRLLDLCNFVTLPFYWGRFEPERGKPITEAMEKAARWCIDHGCETKGHPLCWHTVTAPWLVEMSNEDIIKAQIDRIHRDVGDFAGLIDTWDVINEVVIMPIFDRYENGITRIAQELGRIGIVRTMFEATREANPDTILLLNDFDTSPAYNILIEGCLEAGIDIDVIGIQSHMHQGYWGKEKLLDVLDRFSTFGLPIHFTEVTLVSGHIMPSDIVDLNDYQVEEWPTTPEGEARQAEQAVEFYKTLYAHPAVEAITWWGLPDGGWLNAPSGLIREDYSPKPAYEELLSLVKGEWWTDEETYTTDENGRLTFTGYLGDYELVGPDGSATFSLEKNGAEELEIQL